MGLKLVQPNSDSYSAGSHRVRAGKARRRTVPQRDTLQDSDTNSPPLIHPLTNDPIVDDTRCGLIYNGHIWGYNPSTMLCAGHDDAGGDDDMCGDSSGGPLVVEERGEIIQVGIRSWGAACGAPIFYDVYMRVTDDELRTWGAKHAQ